MKKLLIVACCLLALQSNGQSGDNNLGVIPAPASVKKGKGAFKITPETSILTDSPAHRAIKYFGNTCAAMVMPIALLMPAP